MGKDFQRTLLWVILAVSLFMLWDNYQVYKGGESFFGVPEAQQQAADKKSSVGEVPTAGGEAVAQQAPVSAVEVKNPVVVTTDLLKVTFDSKGASVVKNEFLKIPKHNDWTDVGLAGLILGNEPDENLGNVELFQVSSNRTYVAQSGLVGGSFPNHLDDFKLVSSDLSLGDKDSMDVVFESEKGGILVTKTYTFHKGRYGIDVKTSVKNIGASSVTPSVYYQITRDGGKPEDDNSMTNTFTGAAVYTDEDKYQKISYEDIADNDASFAEKASDGWIAMVQHHFVSAWIPKDVGDRDNFVKESSAKLYSVGSVVSLGQLAPGAEVAQQAVLYSGPQDQNRLEELAPGLDLVVDYGWLTFLAKPIYWLLDLLYGLVGNWGWAIVLLTCIVKLILYPISAAGYRSMARMKEVTPRLKQLQDKYKDDKQRLNQAVMELYRKEKINPVGGCLPIFLQIPVFLALYWVLLGSVELRGAEWILWVNDLSVPDPWFVLPAVMAATMFIQILLNPKPTDPTQAKVMYIMPVVFSVMFFIFASGLVLYWLTNNILSIIQQWWINKTIAAERAKRNS